MAGFFCSILFLPGEGLMLYRSCFNQGHVNSHFSHTELTAFPVLFLEAVQQGCHPVLDTGSPFVDMVRRYRIGVRYDKTESINAMTRHFWTASGVFSHQLTNHQIH